MKAHTATVNEFNGAINFTIQFQRGLNIIGGENGTGKTRLLQTLKSGGNVQAYDSDSYSNNLVFAINPKRNSQRREITQIIQQMRRDNKSFTNFSSEAVGKHFNSGGFDNYSSFGELFMYYFDRLDRTGGDRKASMRNVAEEFNSVIAEIFQEYEISALWNDEQGLPTPTIKKRGLEIPITGLSCGEDEVFSLVLNLYSLRSQFDIFLIDEPETHLNWHLEKLLFKYLKTFSEKYDKQVIIATHSRIVVDKSFKEYSQFLIWSENQVKVTNTLPREQREKLIEDAFSHLQIGGFDSPTVFCEDESHRTFFEELLASFGIENYRICKCDNSANVKSLYRANQNDGGWNNCIFVVDGDNQGKWKHAAEYFHHLKKYCIENYALNIQAISIIYNKTADDIKSQIVSLLKQQKSKLFGKSKSLEFLVDLLSVEHITQDLIDEVDASVIFDGFISWLGENDARAFWHNFFTACKSSDRLTYKEILDESLLNQIEEWANKSIQETP